MGADDGPDIEDDFAVLAGKPVEKKDEKKKVKTIWLHPKNFEAFQVFLKLRTQFVFDLGEMIGLNYQSLEFVMRTFKIKNRIDCFNRIRVIENHILEIRKKAKGKNGSKA